MCMSTVVEITRHEAMAIPIYQDQVHIIQPYISTALENSRLSEICSRFPGSLIGWYA